MHLKLPSLFKNTILSDNHEAAAVVKEMMDENYVTVTQNMMDLVEERKVTKMVDLINPENCGMDQRNKTKYFCSDSMMKYALKEGLERAKRELRES